ncbi:23S rRNA (adenine(2030)-N(6))-methyltransferase RlmJ [Marinobacter halodurans]|uniref:Ribosomal RNA large subunit methyltransferase J n=1 Tax=Marinobacter halodurans TaxID=2528979 RepID=A0ABY1ZM40_9GAMM|nr:23S rRNA (adenine(2030)-N(6))-methyltransferase RlmJ [Marinobacter halodurans]TBW54313.1 23S rRNA (adenine(2030)-N(6))-methyltransferase RlmJ [Marinobacter halodurans]
MLSYLHAFHAGNFADVQKHLGLFLALKMMQAKPSGIACFDTHAGSARYDLQSERPRKTGEAEGGIQRLWQMRRHLQDPEWASFWNVIGVAEGAEQVRFYPGSPAWLEALAREQDPVTAFELHSGESSLLQDWARERRAHVVAGDGFRGLLAELPPPTPRLLTLIDPPYEVKDDYMTTAETVIKAWKRCRHGVYLVWYPLLPEARHEAMIRRLQDSPVTKVLQCHYLLDKSPARGMYGSGLLLVNPPWGWGDRLQSMLDDVAACGAIAARQQVAWAVPEQG